LSQILNPEYKQKNNLKKICIMRTIVKITIIFLLTLVMAYPLSAQKNKDKKDVQPTKDAQKQLTEKSTKQARKEAKKFINEGYYVAPGALPMDKQLERAWIKQYETDDKGLPKYIVESGNSVAESQTAAKLQANETAKLNLAGEIETNVAALIENNIANMQLNNADAASVTKTVGAAKNLIAQELGRTLPLVEIYRKVGKNVEADVRLGYDYTTAMEAAKKVIRKQLEEETKLVQEKLDGLMKF
jgi:hypothetical protein